MNPDDRAPIVITNHEPRYFLARPKSGTWSEIGGNPGTSNLVDASFQPVRVSGTGSSQRVFAIGSQYGYMVGDFDFGPELSVSVQPEQVNRVQGDTRAILTLDGHWVESPILDGNGDGGFTGADVAAWTSVGNTALTWGQSSAVDAAEQDAVFCSADIDTLRGWSEGVWPQLTKVALGRVRKAFEFEDTPGLNIALIEAVSTAYFSRVADNPKAMAGAMRAAYERLQLEQQAVAGPSMR